MGLAGSNASGFIGIDRKESTAKETGIKAEENMMTAPKLIILAGLPGTGKTTLARRLSKALSLVYLRVDCIEAPFIVYHPDAGAQGEGYQALINLAAENLNLGHGVIIDTVNPFHLTRAMFTALAKQTSAETFQFEIKMKDVSLHKKRVEERQSDIPGLHVPAWQDVMDREYEEWDESKDGPAAVIWADDGEQAFLTCLEIIRDAPAGGSC